MLKYIIRKFLEQMGRRVGCLVCMKGRHLFVVDIGKQL